MNRVGMDLCVVLLVILGYSFMWEWANGNEDADSLASAVAIVDTVVLTIYLGVVIIPHYTSRLHDVDVGKLLKSLGLYVPILVLMILLSIHGDLIDNEQQSKIIIAAYILIVLSVVAILRFLYIHYYLKKKGNTDE